MTVIYNRIGTALGDTWAVVNALLHRSVRLGKPVRFHRFSGTTDQTRILVQICALLDSPGRIEITDDPPTEDISQEETWNKALPYFRTRDRWVGDTAITCYQFDGRSSAGEKNPPPEDIPRLLDALQAPLPVGLPFSIEGSITLMRRARLFVGSCSGMAHVAHSVGIPSLLIQYKLNVRDWHGGNQYELCYGTDAAIQVLRHRKCV